ncbi:MAG TPA: hypothetical protein VM674_05550, partial [Candidatus Acidoferrum sp.]|nr:hypothetical protein [Candidatus Acidoferrum sp.]
CRHRAGTCVSLSIKTVLNVIHKLSRCGTGRRSLVIPMALAGIAAGAHGLIVEVHVQPELALSDGAQSITPDAFRQLVDQVEAVATALKPRAVVPV